VGSSVRYSFQLTNDEADRLERWGDWNEWSFQDAADITNFCRCTESDLEARPWSESNARALRMIDFVQVSGKYNKTRKTLAEAIHRFQRMASQMTSEEATNLRQKIQNNFRAI